MTWLNAPSGKKQDRLPVRAAEHNVIMPSGDGKEEASETCTVITTLLDHEAAPADQVRDTYLTRWSASETTFGEDKTTITGRGEPHLRPRPALRLPAAGHPGSLGLADRHPAGPRQRSRRAAQRGTPPPARCAAGTPRPVTADEESFTAARHHMIRSMASTQVTATSSLDALAAAADAAARAAPAHPEPPRTAAALQTRAEGTPEIPARHRAPRRPSPGNPRSPSSHPASPSPPHRLQPVRKEEPPRPRGRGPWNRAPAPPRHAGPSHARRTTRKQTQEHVEHRTQ